MTHNYNANPIVANNEENNVSDPQTSDLIINLEKKILSRFDGLDKELLDFFSFFSIRAFFHGH